MCGSRRVFRAGVAVNPQTRAGRRHAERARTDAVSRGRTDGSDGVDDRRSARENELLLLLYYYRRAAAAPTRPLRSRRRRRPIVLFYFRFVLLFFSPRRLPRVLVTVYTVTRTSLRGVFSGFETFGPRPPVSSCSVHDVLRSRENEFTFNPFPKLLAGRHPPARAIERTPRRERTTLPTTCYALRASPFYPANNFQLRLFSPFFFFFFPWPTGRASDVSARLDACVHTAIRLLATCSRALSVSANNPKSIRRVERRKI